jgi:hypothetical protein
MTPAPPTPGSPLQWSEASVEREREHGIEVGRRWAERACAHELASIATASFDDLSEILPPDVSDQFVGGFREAVLHVWRGAPRIAA